MPAFTLDTQNDYLYMLNRETVSLADGLGNPVGGSIIPGTITDCIRMGGSKPETAPSRGKYLERRVSWRLPFGPTGDVIILPGWTITDAYWITFTILRVTRPDNWHDAWKCESNSLTFNGQLDDQITYYQSSGSSSSTGARQVTDTQVGAAVAAAIEPDGQRVGDMFGAKNMEEYFLVYLDVDPSGDGPSIIAAGDLLKDQNGQFYEIDYVFTRDRLDVKPTFRCRKKL